MWVASEPCAGSVMPKAKPSVARQQLGHPLRLLLVGAVVQHQQQTDVVADDRRLVLQVVVQPEPRAGEVLADDGHAQVGAVATAVLLWEGIAVVAGGVGAPAHLAEELLPLLVRQAAALPVGAGVLAPVVEEAVVVVGHLQRQDLALDELVELGEIVLQLGRDGEIHSCSIPRRVAWVVPPRRRGRHGAANAHHTFELSTRGWARPSARRWATRPSGSVSGRLSD